MPSTYSGYTASTYKHLLLDGGAFYKDFIVGVDTPETAVHKLLGATRGGGHFKAAARFRVIKVDGAPDGARGSDRIEGWDVLIDGNVLEATPETFKLALGAADIDEKANKDYLIVRGRNFVEDRDYLENITWIGTLSGSDEPVIIQVLNAFSTAGLEFSPVDQDESVFKVSFNGRTTRTATGKQSPPPFLIYYPKRVFLPAPTLNPLFADETTLSGLGSVGATVNVRLEADDKQIATGTADNRGLFSIEIAKQTVGTVLLINQTVGEEKSGDFRLTVMPADYRAPEDGDEPAAGNTEEE